MRRVSAILLLVVAGLLVPMSPLVSALTASTMLPVCCRAHGRHHCMMNMGAAGMDGMAAPAAGAQDGHALREPGCPYTRLNHAVPVTAGIHARRVELAGALTAVLLLVLAADVRPILAGRFRRDPRGPPVVLA